MNWEKEIAKTLHLMPKQVGAVLKLLDEGSTIPFIARYRKEATGSLDEVQIEKIQKEYSRLKEMEDRRRAILKSLEKQEITDPALLDKIKKAATLAELEDLYLPHKPKKRTKGSIAREKGLENLARDIFSQVLSNPKDEAIKYTGGKDKASTVEEALEGAGHIISEWINEDPRVRKKVRNLFENSAVIESKVVKKKEKEASKYKDYFDFEEKISKIPSHRILAIFRGEKEGFLRVKIGPDVPSAQEAIVSVLDIKSRNACTPYIMSALEDGYKRLTAPSLETEMHNLLKEKGDEKAIEVFRSNLKELLLASPFGGKTVIAFDPGFRTGSKMVALSKRGDLLENKAIYPLEPQRQIKESRSLIEKWIAKYKPEALVLGNGTGGRELESFLRDFAGSLPVCMVNESGASVYSASETARKEFPNQDITVRGAVSIGRRFQDPLAELVKIDPKSIGVGQYQHDVNQKELEKSLVTVVVNCVNQVGVELNTASVELLQRVSGLNPALASRVVGQRGVLGGYRDRKDLKKVKGLGPKAFEQCAGFLRIEGGKNPLDNTGIHPEQYTFLQKLAKDHGLNLREKGSMIKLADILKKEKSGQIGAWTLKDIVGELEKPGRDPRDPFEVFEFNQDVNKIEDLEVSMRLPGIVTNVTAFGAFVDVGVHQDGLVHISHLANGFVKDPADVVKTGQKVTVKVLEVDLSRKRISLSMKDA